MFATDDENDALFPTNRFMRKKWCHMCIDNHEIERSTKWGGGSTIMSSTRQSRDRAHHRSSRDPEIGKLLSNVHFALHLLELCRFETFTPFRLLLELFDRFELQEKRDMVSCQSRQVTLIKRDAKQATLIFLFKFRTFFVVGSSCSAPGVGGTDVAGSAAAPPLTPFVVPLSPFV